MDDHTALAYYDRARLEALAAIEREKTERQAAALAAGLSLFAALAPVAIPLGVLWLIHKSK